MLLLLDSELEPHPEDVKEVEAQQKAKEEKERTEAEKSEARKSGEKSGGRSGSGTEESCYGCCDVTSSNDNASGE